MLQWSDKTLYTYKQARHCTFNNSQYPGRFALVSRQNVIHWLNLVPRKDATDCLFVGPVNKGHTILGGSIGYHKGVFSREIIRSLETMISNFLCNRQHCCKSHYFYWS